MKNINMLMEGLMGFVVILILFLCYLVYNFFIKIYIDAYKFKKMDPQLKTFIAPFSGLLEVQKLNVEKYGDSHWFVKDMIRKNPDQLAYLTNLGHRPFLILCDPKLIKELSLNPKKFKKYNMLKHSGKAYTKGIFFVEDNDWNAERTLIRHTFSFQELKRMLPIMNTNINRFITQIKTKMGSKSSMSSNSYQLRVVQQAELLIGQILVQSFFSEDTNNKIVGNKNLSISLAQFTTKAFNRARTGSNVLCSLFFGQKVTSINFNSQDKQLEHLIDNIRIILKQIIQEHRTNSKNDFLSHYITQQQEIDKEIEEAKAKGKQHKLRKITDQQILQQIMSFYFAGIDTTGHLVAMTFYALAQYSQYKERIIKEIQEIMPNDECITYENLQKMDFLGKFLDQCLRMWPPAVGILARQTRQPLTIGPYTLPCNMLIGTNIIGLMYNEKYYDNPSIFNPDRWNKRDSQNSEPYSFIPFSAGSRSCIGKYMALMEAKLILIHFLKNFNFTRTLTPLRMHAKFLYEPVDEKLVQLTKIQQLQI